MINLHKLLFCGGRKELWRMALEKCATYYCIAWCISWKPHQSLSLGHAWRFWLVELSRKSSPSQASEPTAGSHSNCRSSHGKGCCRKASILIRSGRERWGWTERGRREERGTKHRGYWIIVYLRLATCVITMKQHRNWSWEKEPADQ